MAVNSISDILNNMQNRQAAAPTTPPVTPTAPPNMAGQTESAGIRGQTPPQRPSVVNQSIKEFTSGNPNLKNSFNNYNPQNGWAQGASPESLGQHLYGNSGARASGPANYGVPMDPKAPNFTMNGPSSEVRSPSRALTNVAQPPNFELKGGPYTPESPRTNLPALIAPEPAPGVRPPGERMVPPSSGEAKFGAGIASALQQYAAGASPLGIAARATPLAVLGSAVSAAQDPNSNIRQAWNTTYPAIKNAPTFSEAMGQTVGALPRMGTALAKDIANPILEPINNFTKGALTALLGPDSAAAAPAPARQAVSNREMTNAPAERVAPTTAQGNPNGDPTKTVNVLRFGRSASFDPRTRIFREATPNTTTTYDVSPGAAIGTIVNPANSLAQAVRGEMQRNPNMTPTERAQVIMDKGLEQLSKSHAPGAGADTEALLKLNNMGIPKPRGGVDMLHDALRQAAFAQYQSEVGQAQTPKERRQAEQRYIDTLRDVAAKQPSYMTPAREE